MGFDQVVIRNKTERARNIHLAVHPFAQARLLCMDSPTNYGLYSNDPEAEWSEELKALAAQLWEGIPGLDALLFANGTITIQHCGVFDDAEIIKAAAEIIRPVLEKTLAFQKLIS